MSLLLVVRPLAGEPFDVTLEDLVAEGATAVVHAARVKETGELLVVKRAKHGHELLLQTERAVMERLDHPNVVRYRGASELARRGVLVYERLAGPPLSLLNGPGARAPFLPLPPGRAIELAFDLFRALGHLHAKGFVHGKVRPASLLVRAAGATPGEVLRSVARGRGAGVVASPRNVRPLEWHARWRSGERGATKIPPPERDPLFTAPDLLAPGPKSVEAELAGDVYGGALVLWALLTGRLPFDAQRRPVAHENRDALARWKRDEARGRLSPVALDALGSIPLHDTALEGGAARWIDFTLAVSELLRRCLDPEPALRPGAEEVRRVFERELLGVFRSLPEGDRLAPVKGPIALSEGAKRPSRRVPARPSTRGSLREPLAQDERTRLHAPVLARETPEGWTFFSLADAAERIRIEDGVVEPRNVVTLGRAAGSDVLLDDLSVSKRHATLARKGGRWFVEDVGSAHGTRVDGRKVRVGAPFEIVAPRAVIELGEARVVFLEEEPLRALVARS